jgi:hypothetical protein
VGAHVSDRRAWRALGLSVTGEAHLERGLQGQDAFAHHTAADGTVVLAVADGVSTARRGREGAAIACGAAIDHAVALLKAPASREDALVLDRLVRGILAEAHRRLLAATGALDDAVPRDAGFATTLAVAAIAGSAAAVGAVGDAFAVARRADSSLHLLLPPRVAGDYVNRTATIDAPSALGRARHVKLEDSGLEAMVLSTDGLAEASIDCLGQPWQRVHPDLLGGTLAHLDRCGSIAELAQTLSGDPRLLQVTDDDRTLAIAVRRG